MNLGPSLPPLSGTALDEFRRFAAVCADEATAEAAADVVAVARPLLLGFSGWPAAGKDTVPLELYRQLGVTGAEHIYFAVPLKQEVDQVIDLCRGADDEAGAADAVASTMGVPADDARWAASIIFRCAADDPEVHARTRTPEVRQLLQVWGTDVRRKGDPDYWVKRALAPAVEAVAAGSHAFLTDVRFPNEITGAQNLGFFVARLEVSRATVVERLWQRDGIRYEESDLDAMLAHPAESSLDGFGGFDLVVDNEGTVEQAVAAVRASLGV